MTRVMGAQHPYYPEHVRVDCFACRIREGLAGPQEPALFGHRSAVGGLVGAGRMPERSQHRVSGGQDGRSERPAMGSGQPRTPANTWFIHSLLVETTGFFHVEKAPHDFFRGHLAFRSLYRIPGPNPVALFWVHAGTNPLARLHDHHRQQRQPDDE